MASNCAPRYMFAPVVRNLADCTQWIALIIAVKDERVAWYYSARPPRPCCPGATSPLGRYPDASGERQVYLGHVSTALLAVVRARGRLHLRFRAKMQTDGFHTLTGQIWLSSLAVLTKFAVPVYLSLLRLLQNTYKRFRYSSMYFRTFWSEARSRCLFRSPWAGSR